MVSCICKSHEIKIFLKPFFFSEEIAEVKTELEEEGFTSDEAVKLIQQVYKKIGGFDNKSKEHSYPVHEKVAGQFSSKGTDPLGHRWGILADFWVSHEIGSGNFQHMLDL